MLYKILITLVIVGNRGLPTRVERSGKRTCPLPEPIPRRRSFSAPLHLREANYQNPFIRHAPRRDLRKSGEGIKRCRNSAAALRRALRQKATPQQKGKALLLTTGNTMGVKQSAGLRHRKRYCRKRWPRQITQLFLMGKRILKELFWPTEMHALFYDKS